MQDDVQFYVKAIEGRKLELQNSSWLAGVFEQLETFIDCVDEIRCLALGSVSDYVNPRFQLALLLLISEKLKATKLTAWDPAFSDSDKLVLAHYDIEVCEADPARKESLLWYVPHGPFSLVLNLPAVLGNNVYIGNDLSVFSVEDRSDEEQRVIEDYRAHSRICAIKCQRQDRWQLAFSSTAIHKRISE